MRTSLTMKRTGDFTVQTSGNNPCGITNPLALKYEVSIECSVELDKRGFIFDQMTVTKFFAEIKLTDLSCEQFAIQCSRKLFSTIKKENPDCQINRMTLSLSPHPFAATMTFLYEQ